LLNQEHQVQFLAVDHQRQLWSFLQPEAAEEAVVVAGAESRQQQPVQLRLQQQQQEVALLIHRMQLVWLLWAVEDLQILRTLLESISQSMAQSMLKVLLAQLSELSMSPFIVALAEPLHFRQSNDTVGSSLESNNSRH
jgi:hypothetical protein